MSSRSNARARRAALILCASVAAWIPWSCSAATRTLETGPNASGSAVPPFEPGAESARVVEAARVALGWDALSRSRGAVRVTAPAFALGVDATRTILFDGTGRYVQVVDGPLGGSGGHDGRVTWARDWTDTPRVLVLGDRAEADLERVLLTGAWTLPGAPLVFAERSRAEGGEIVLPFRHADGILSGELRLDAATLRPRSAWHASDATPTTLTFSEWGVQAGFAFPARFEEETDGRVQSSGPARVEVLARVEDADFAARTERPRDARFDAAVAPELEVRVAKSGHVLVHPRVDGQDLGWFIFDTGAGTNCIANHVAPRLAGEAFGRIAARGVGGTVDARFHRAREIVLGPITVEGPTLMGLDLQFLEPHFGVEVGGILGFELLARCVAEIDMQRGRIALHDPARYALPAEGRWEELLLHGRVPCVRAAFETHEAVFRLDTGAAGDTVTFHYQATHDLGLTESRETRDGQAGGVGGSVPIKVGRLESFRLGGREFGAVEASFVETDVGAFSDDSIAGNIGGKLLEPFHLVLDYPNGRVGFVPRDPR